jgi:hypothetical protein
MTMSADDHRLELLRVFKNSPADLDANRLGQLGPGQGRRLRRSAASSILIMLAVAAVFIALIIAVGTKPIAPWRWGLIAVVALAGVAVGVQRSRELRRALRDRTVESLTGPVTVRMQGRSGWWLAVAGQSFHLPVRFWHVGAGLPYRVYVAPAAKLIVAMEPAELAEFPQPQPRPAPEPAGRPSDRTAQSYSPGLLAAVDPVNPAALRLWAQALCTIRAADAQGILRGLRFGGAVVADDYGRPCLQPPPAQLAWARVDERNGVLSGLNLSPGPVPVTRGGLDAVLGAGRAYPRVHWDSPFTLTYVVTVPDAPFGCDITAYFRDEPGPGTAAHEISLRRHRG